MSWHAVRKKYGKPTCETGSVFSFRGTDHAEPVLPPLPSRFRRSRYHHSINAEGTRMTKYLPAACLWIACLSLASGAGCAQRPADSESVTKPAATAPEKPAGEAGKAEAFVSRWSYDRKESCASKYTATLSIDEVAGQTARGEWTSYNSEDGYEGNVIGELLGDKLLLRFCHATGARQGEQACPNFRPAKVYLIPHITHPRLRVCRAMAASLSRCGSTA
jgi:hypothetical protein